MPVATSIIDQCETLLGKVATETLLAREGSDEGLIPAYALLGQLEELAATEADLSELLESVRHVQAYLDHLLNEACPVDAAGLAYIRDFATWSADALEVFRNGGRCPAFPPYETNAAAETPAEEAPDGEPGTVAQHRSGDEDVLLVLNLTDDPELLREFHTEAREHLEAIEEHVLTLEHEPANKDSLAAVFRAYHTIKGVAGFLHLLPIQELAHEVESLLDLARNGQITLDSEMITLILKSRDALEQLANQVAEGLESHQQPKEVVPVRKLIKAVYTAAQRGVHGETAVTAEAAQEVAELEQEEKTSAKAGEHAHARNRQSATIRVDAEKVANLMDMVGELVIVESQLAESAAQDGKTDNALRRNMALLNRITKELQHTSMALRMVPIKPTFQKVGRMVRDLAKAFSKQIDFVSSGEDTELDRNMVEAIGDPLIHMVRNSIDHGLEPTAEDRVKVGKPAAGRITLKAYQMGSQIVIELSDDGRGINTERVLKKAREKGLVPADKEFTDQEIHQLIFLPGFSTAEVVTDISGRGVGMDVVRRNIEAMRGQVLVESEPGQGTTIKIKLPLTAAIIEGLVVKVGGDRFILPTNAVRVIIRPQPKDLATITGSAEVVLLRDQTIPLIRLHREFNIANAVQDPTQASVVIIDSFGKSYALLVDEMVNKQEVVIKNLGHVMREVSGVAGGAILGDGTIALILDTASLLARALRGNN